MQVFCIDIFLHNRSQLTKFLKKQTNRIQNNRPKENASQIIIVQRHEN